MKDNMSLEIRTSRGFLILREEEIFEYLPQEVIHQGFQRAKSIGRALRDADVKGILAREDWDAEQKRKELRGVREHFKVFFGLEEEGGDMVTIAKLAEESGVNERTTRNRITKAIDRGVLTAWEKQGGTILIQRQAGLKIVRAVGQVIKKE